MEFTAWAHEHLHRNVIPAEHRTALVTEIKHWLLVAPHPAR